MPLTGSTDQGLDNTSQGHFSRWDLVQLDVSFAGMHQAIANMRVYWCKVKTRYARQLKSRFRSLWLSGSHALWSCLFFFHANCRVPLLHFNIHGVASL